MKKILFIILSVILIFGLTACDPETPTNINNGGGSKTTSSSGKYSNVKQNPVVTMTMENGDVIKIELYPQIAPQTVENFISLINKGFYNGLTFHRVIPNFMAQGGDPNGDGTGDAGYNITGEFSANNFKNELSHDVGVISMARATDYNTASADFFIVTDPSSKKSLDGLYASFGKVIEGMDAVYTIVNSEVIRRNYSEDFLSAITEAGGILEPGSKLESQHYKETLEMDRPINPPVIATMTVDTFGYTYDEPTKIQTKKVATPSIQENIEEAEPIEEIEAE